MKNVEGVVGVAGGLFEALVLGVTFIVGLFSSPKRNLVNSLYESGDDKDGGSSGFSKMHKKEAQKKLQQETSVVELLRKMRYFERVIDKLGE